MLVVYFHIVQRYLLSVEMLGRVQGLQGLRYAVCTATSEQVK